MRFLLISAALGFLLCLPSVQANDGPDWLNDPNDLPKGVVSNENVMIRKDSSAMSLMMQAERALKSDHIDRALDLIKRSLELDNDDLDAHMSYASALEKKLGTQKIDDPKIFNLCVNEWLAVLRNKYGNDKSQTLDGVGLPLFNGKFLEDDDRQAQARSHLVKLTGISPKPWETNRRYLAKVERHGEASVSARIVHDANAGKKVAPDAESGSTEQTEEKAHTGRNASDAHSSVNSAGRSSVRSFAGAGAQAE